MPDSSTPPAPAPAPATDANDATDATDGTSATVKTWALTLALTLMLALWVIHGLGGRASPERPDIPQSPPRADAPRLLPCVSYAPFRRPGHSPFDPHLRLDREAIAEDLRLIVRLSPCVRLYGVGHGLDQVPGVARELGLKVVLGAWIDRDDTASQRELQTALQLAHTHRDVVRLLVVGNEVLLRQERTPQELATLLAQTRRDSPVPVAYADVWEFWLRHADVLSPTVDVAAIHILPYWEDEPVAQAHAVSHVLSIHEQVRQRLEPLPVWLAETGWPSQGRARGPAVPGPAEQAKFMREWLGRAPGAGVDYNLIEAFDQPWKRHLEGAMGAGWGLMDAQGRIKDPAFPAGPLPADPRAQASLWASAAGAVAGLLLFIMLMRRGRAQTAWPMLPGVALAAGLWAHHAAGLQQWARNPIEWAWAIGLAAMTLAFVVLHVQRPLRPGPHSDQTMSAAATTLLFMLAATLLTLVFDGRYRELPVALVGAAAVSVLVGGHRPVPGSLPPRPLSAQARGLVMVNLAAACVLPVLEGLHNLQALMLCAALLLLCGQLLLNHRQALHRLR